MNPTLNSPKYADPKSLAFQMYKKQQDRKQRKGYPYDPQLEQRYFRRNEGSTDYATHSSVTVDRIVMDVNPSAGNGNTGLPTGAPAVTNNVMQTIDFAYSGTISELYRNGSDYFKGIIANVKYYLSGELIHSWSINSNSSTESDSVGGLVLTFINGNADDWGLFDRQANGDWLGQELVVNGGFDTDSGWTKTGGATISGGLGRIDGAGGNTLLFQDIVSIGLEYRVEFIADIITPSATNVMIDNDSNTIATVSTGVNFAEWDQTASQGFLLFRSNLGNYTVDNISVKEVLKNA